MALNETESVTVLITRMYGNLKRTFWFIYLMIHFQIKSQYQNQLFLEQFQGLNKLDP